MMATDMNRMTKATRGGIEYRIGLWNSLEGDALRNEIAEWTARIEYVVEKFPYDKDLPQWRRDLMSEMLNTLVDNAILQLERLKWD